MASKRQIIQSYVRMWPREVFDAIEGRPEEMRAVRSLLAKHGVYVLYRDDQPYYVGKARRVFGRLRGHATLAVPGGLGKLI